MRPLKFTINITIDGCCDHRVGMPTEALHEYARAGIEAADALLCGRVTYQMMEEAWRGPAERPAWMQPFARAMDAARKYVVTRTLPSVDWNAEIVQGDLETAVRALKAQPGRGIAVVGTQLARSLAGLGLIDAYELIVHPRIAGHGPTLFAGLDKIIDLKLVGRQELGEGLVVMKYETVR